MRADEFLSLPKEQRVSGVFYVLLGDDELMKDIVVDELLEAHDLAHSDKELHATSDGEKVARLWEEGSILGSRFLVVRVSGALKRAKELLTSVSLALADDILILRMSKAASKTEQEIVGRSTEIRCSSPRNKNDRQKIIWSRLKAYKLATEEGVVRQFAERTQSLFEIEQNIRLLSLVADGGFITSKLFEYIVSEPEHQRDTTRAVLNGNSYRLCRLLDQWDPLQVLREIHLSLFRLYYWIELTSGEGDEAAAVSLLGIPMRSKTYWRAAKTKFHPVMLRGLMVEINRIYRDVLSGRADESWVGRLKYLLRDRLKTSL